MENPLTKEQIEELNNIVKLDPEEQKKVLPGFLQKLNPEQIEFIKGSQSRQCVFCLIKEGKVPSKKIYEDDSVMVVLDINPANKGHVLVFPKKHHEILSLVEDVSHLFNVVNAASGAVFESVNAEGTNIFIANGVVAGQMVDHVVVNIIPRFKDDKVQFSWNKVEVEEKEMENIALEISSNLNKRLPKKEVIEEKKPEILKVSIEERIP